MTGSWLQDIARVERHDWTTWVPVLLRAQADPDAFVATFRALSDEDQYGLLSRLRADGEAFSDGVIVLLGHGSGTAADAQIRAFASVDAVDAAGRRVTGIQRWIAELGAHVDDGPELPTGTAAAELVVRLEQERLALRAESAGTPFERARDLAAEVAALRVRKQVLESWDQHDQETARDALVADVARLDKAQDAVSRELAGIEEERRTAEAGLVRQRDALAAARDRLARLYAERDRGQAENEQTERQLGVLAVELADVQRELRTRRDQLEKQLSAIDGERNRLAELTDSPVAEHAAKLVADIDDLYDSLPADLAERSFGTANRGRSG